MARNESESGKSERGEPDTGSSSMAFFNAASCQVRATAWMVQLLVGDAVPGRDGTVTEVPRIVVGLPWTLAKVIHQVLGSAIESYEKQEGEIVIPRTVKTAIDAQMAAAAKK